MLVPLGSHIPSQISQAVAESHRQHSSAGLFGHRWQARQWRKASGLDVGTGRAAISSQADRFTHNIFVVQNNDRLRILEKQERGTEWGFEQWNTLAIERNIPQCSLKVWIDNSLVFESNDARLMKKGKVGLGNSGDSYKLDNLKLWIAD